MVIHTDELPESTDGFNPQRKVEFKETKDLLLETVNTLSDKQKQVLNIYDTTVLADVEDPEFENMLNRATVGGTFLEKVKRFMPARRL